jgi:anaerobic selenocysteine-containing dehydrogenase
MEPEPNGDAPTGAVAGEQPDTEAEQAEAAPPPPEPARLGIPQVAPPEPSSVGGSVPAGGGQGSAGAVSGLRLVARRRLWDGGTQVQTVPSLADLHPSPCLLVHTSVLAELGSADGEHVTVTSARGSLVMPAVGDESLPVGTAVMAWNLPGAAAGDLIDSFATYTEVAVAPTPPQGGGTHAS